MGGYLAPPNGRDKEASDCRRVVSLAPLHAKDCSRPGTLRDQQRANVAPTGSERGLRIRVGRRWLRRVAVLMRRPTVTAMRPHLLGGCPPPVTAGYCPRPIDADNVRVCAVCDASTGAALDHVRGRLSDEFGSRVTVDDITRYIAQAHADLGDPPRGTLPELLERLARIRLLQRVGGPSDCGDAEH